MSATGTGAQTMSFVENYETEQPILELARFMHTRQQANKTLPSYQFLSSSRTRLVERGAGRMGEPTANLWEGLQEARVSAPRPHMPEKTTERRVALLDGIGF